MANSFARCAAAAIGALLAVATIPLRLLLSKMQSEQFAAVVLAVIGVKYVGFALQKMGNRAQIATALTIATGFFAAALAGQWATPWILAVAWGAHETWGYAPHLGLIARVHTLKVRRHTLMVSSILRRRRLVGAGALGGYVEPACLK